MYPDWALKFKEKGTVLRPRNGSFLLYRCHSVRVPGKKNPQMVQDELIGTISSKGIEYCTKRNIDVLNIEIKPFSEFNLYLKMSSKEKKTFLNVYLVKAGKHYYFQKLSNVQIDILKNYDVVLERGIDE